MSVEFFKSIALLLFLQGMYKITQTFSLLVKLMPIPLFCFHTFTLKIFQSLFQHQCIPSSIKFFHQNVFFFFSSPNFHQKEKTLNYFIHSDSNDQKDLVAKKSSKIDSFRNLISDLKFRHQHQFQYQYQQSRILHSHNLNQHGKG